MTVAGFLFVMLSASPPGPEVVEPMTLEDATAFALAHANQMIQSKEDVLLVDADYATALSAILPRVDLRMSAGGFYQRNRILETRNQPQPPDEPPIPVFGDFRDIPTNSFLNGQLAASLAVRQLVFDGGRWWTVLGQVEDNRDSAKEAFREVTNLVRALVARTFFGVERARQEKLTLAAQVEVDRAQLKRAQGLLQAGGGAPADVATAKRNLASDKIALLAADTTEGQAERAFNLQIGRSPGLPVVLAMPASVTSSASTARFVPGIERLRDIAKDRRPDLVSRRAALNAARKDVTIARADYWPTITLEGSYNRSSRRIERIFGNPLENYTLNADVVLTWNLFEGFATNANVDRAKTQLRQQEASYWDAERTVLSQVEDSFQRYRNQERADGFAREQVAAATEAVRLARGLYEVGRGTSLELRDAELGLTRARIARTNARLAAEIAYADLVQAVGTKEWATN